LKKSHKVSFVLLAVIVLAVVGFRAMQPKEPEYQGRKLSEWIADLYGPSHLKRSSEVVVKEAKDVFLPFIEERLRNTKPPQFKTQLQVYLFNAQAATGLGFRQSDTVQWAGCFNALELYGVDALPVLERLLLEKHTSEEAAAILAKLSAVDVLKKGTESSRDRYVQQHSISGLGKVTQRKSEAAEVLLQLTRGTKRSVVTSAIYSLGSLAAVPETVVPRLCELLKSKDEFVQIQSIHTLVEFGTNAMVALPLLLELKTSSVDPIVRNAADNSANKIQGKWIP
jgi:HEAT repeat protein